MSVFVVLLLLVVAAVLEKTYVLMRDFHRFRGQTFGQVKNIQRTAASTKPVPYVNLKVNDQSRFCRITTFKCQGSHLNFLALNLVMGGSQFSERKSMRIIDRASPERLFYGQHPSKVLTAAFF